MLRILFFGILLGLCFQFGHFKYFVGFSTACILIVLTQIRDKL